MKKIFILFIILYSVIFFSLVNDYGMTWDCWEYPVGDKNLAYLTSLDQRHLNYSQPSVEYDFSKHPNYNILQSEVIIIGPKMSVEIWPVGSLTSAISKKIFGGIYPTHAAQHIGNLFWLIILFSAVYYFTKKIFNEKIALISCLLLAFYPRFFAHSFFNFKDIPAMAMYAVSCFSFYLALQKKCLPYLALSAITWGIGLATKHMAYVQCIHLVIYFILHLILTKGQTIKSKKMILGYITYPFLGIATAIACWPYMWHKFPEPLIKFWTSIQRRTGDSQGTWDFTPLEYLFRTTPSIYLLLLLASLFIVYKQTKRKYIRPINILLILWIFIPILFFTRPGSLVFDACRHWMQAYIPISIMVARMIYTLANKISTQKNTQIMVAITTVALLPMIIWVYKNHPNQIVFYNIISGGTKAVEKRQLVDYADYWGNGYLQGIKWLNNNAKERAIIIADEGQHIVTFQHNLLRRDLQLLPLNLFTITRLRQFPQETTVYYMTLNRTHNTQLLLLNESSLTYEVKVDELPILYIHQTDAKHMAIEVEKRYVNP